MIKFFKQWLTRKPKMSQPQSAWDGECSSAEEFHQLVRASVASECSTYVIDGRSGLTLLDLEDVVGNKFCALKKHWNTTNTTAFFSYLFALNKKWVNTPLNGETPIQYSAKNNALATCKILVEHGAQAWLDNVPQGRQPFMLANYHQQMVLESKQCAAFLASTKISPTYWAEHVSDGFTLTFLHSLTAVGLKNFSTDVLKCVLLLIKDCKPLSLKIPNLQDDITNQLQNATLQNAVASIAANSEPTPEPKKRKM